MKKITICHYPATFSFTTKVELPTFEYGCEVRTKLAEKAMRRHNISSPCHGYDEYVVECVEIDCENPNHEFWQLGS